MLRRLVWPVIGLLILLPLQVEAQSFERQVRNYLADAGGRLLSGYRSLDEVYTGALDDDDEEDIWITLAGGGDFAIVGVCDEDCGDVDLFLYDEDGDQIDSDASIDDEPVVEVTTNRSGDYRVRVRMYSCSVEPCFYAVGVYQRGGRRGGRGAGQFARNECSGGTFTQQACENLYNAWDEGLSDRGFELDEALIESSLDDDDEEEFWFELRRNQSYAFLAACDEDCQDIDLFVYDEDGDQIDSDVSLDAVPTIRVTPRRTADYRIRVRMYNCTTDPCYYVLGKFSR
ncbi:MAG: hypothetical protein ACE5FJ_10445 [Gemmatimonadales bacterium]